MKMPEPDRAGDYPRNPRIEIEVTPKEEPNALWWAVTILCVSVWAMLFALHGCWPGLVEAIERGMEVIK